jgi:hypothetical protein
MRINSVLPEVVADIGEAWRVGAPCKADFQDCRIGFHPDEGILFVDHTFPEHEEWLNGQGIEEFIRTTDTDFRARYEIGAMATNHTLSFLAGEARESARLPHSDLRMRRDLEKAKRLYWVAGGTTLYRGEVRMATTCFFEGIFRGVPLSFRLDALHMAIIGRQIHGKKCVQFGEDVLVSSGLEVVHCGPPGIHQENWQLRDSVSSAA